MLAVSVYEAIRESSASARQDGRVDMYASLSQRTFCVP